MTSTATRSLDTGKGGSRRRAKPGRRKWILWTVLAVVVVILIVVGSWLYWLTTGLLDASRDVQDKAAVAQGELQAFRDTLKAGDEKAAEAHLDAGAAALAEAKKSAQADQVRIAKDLPYVGNTVSDLDHLLKGAGIMTASGRDALTVYRKFSGDDSELFEKGKFSLPAIGDAQKSVEAIKGSMDRAEAELRKVTGKGPKGGEALEKKKAALESIGSLRAEIAPLEPVLKALPAAVGANGRVKYLVAVMNPAEMRASGGAPLSLVFVSFKNGRMTIPLQGTTSSITRGSASGLLGDSPELIWDRVKGDPFQPGAGEPQRFVNASFNPDFPMSAEQLRRATPTFFGQKTDGVIALDLVAVSHLLKVLGPIESRYGTLTPENLVQKLLIRAYKEQGTEIALRQQENDNLMTIVMSNLVAGGGGLLDKARALGEAIPARHLQMYFKDERLQQLVEEKHLGGEVPDPTVGNLSAVFTQNGNGSKLDVFQERTVKERIQLRKDGSAMVTRTVRVNNPTPPYIGAGPDSHRGYNTRWATNLIINLMPDGSKVVQEPTVDLVGTVRKGTDQDGRTYAKAAVVTPPDSEATVTWKYVVPKAATKHGDAWRLLDYVAPQSMLKAPQLELTVVAPDGWKAEPAKGWTVNGDTATIAVAMDRVRVLKVQVSPR